MKMVTESVTTTSQVNVMVTEMVTEMALETTVVDSSMKMVTESVTTTNQVNVMVTEMVTEMALEMAVKTTVVDSSMKMVTESVTTARVPVARDTRTETEGAADGPRAGITRLFFIKEVTMRREMWIYIGFGIILAVLAATFLADDDSYWGPCGGGRGYGQGHHQEMHQRGQEFFGVGFYGFGLLFWVLVAFFIVVVFFNSTKKEDAITILNRRYARGELSQEEYKRMREELSQ